jgi:HD-GYP domain-containing protein (c-di-GMP phosphodiesterase class II)
VRDKVKTCFIYLLNCLQTGKLFSESHPTFKEFVGRLYDVIQSILLVKRELILGIVSGELAWEDEIFLDLGKKLGTLVDFLKEERIERIIFQQGLKLEELNAFIAFLCRIKMMDKVDEEEYFALHEIANIRAGRIRSPVKIEDPAEKAKEMMRKYNNSVEGVSNSLNVVIGQGDLDYLDLRFNVLNSMEDFMGKHQELISLISVKEKDPLTFIHLMNVCLLAMFFASKLEFGKDDVLDLGIAALYHDIGKLYISQSILQKKTALAEEEFIQITDHPLLGVKILNRYRETLGILPFVVALEHHLRYDLTGYPKVKYPRKPHTASLMVSICDVYDALALKRTYKKDYPPDKIYELMMQNKGKLFEPLLLDKFFQGIGFWPVGTIVSLSDQSVAVVREINEEDMFRPKVEVVAPENKKELINLAKLKTIQIIEALNPHGKGQEYVAFI